MRKRLRKKRHVGEFQEFGAEITVTLKSDINSDSFFEELFCDALEANGLAFGGGGTDFEFSGFVELGRRDVHASNLNRLRAWLAAEPRVESYLFGDPIDAWMVAE